MKNLSRMAMAIDSMQVQNILTPVFEIINVVVPILLTLVGTVGSIWCIVLGVKFAKAEDPQEHEKAKKALINAIIGFVMIFVLLIMLKLALPVFTNYYQSFKTTTT